ncbi:helix-turn-helix transcriptional regulator [Streptomyces sp. NBC_00536]|uniref:helix-turn-helix domain-containing protein n=1 Tax=Streptomyces sp. NBC_00536 TaxID=2975769 RepID=UPI002E7FC4B7|nr:helix-turn-helix transcriptional regulator [Streptomyces sp. NBC_00536]WUC78941.1 helix-turn-helix transcriptional regulator [Streptomyces sp. NBC_00536]
MSETRRPRAATQYGSTAANVAANVRRVRELRGLSIYSLSAALEKVGRPIAPSAVAKIERQERQVTVDDLSALAVVFGVSPSALLLPLTPSPKDTVEVTGGGSMPASDAWAWAQGRRPLLLKEGFEQTQQMEHQLYGLPQWLREPNYLILRGERTPDQLAQVRQKYEFLASIGGASLDRLKQLDPEAFEEG